MNSIYILSLAFCVSVIVVDSQKGSRIKRVINGIEVDSIRAEKTSFLVAITMAQSCAYQESWLTQNDQSGYCDRYFHFCGGSLVQPDFVLTACHCLLHEEFYFARVPLPEFHPSLADFTTSTTVKPWTQGTPFMVRMQPKHPIYNRMALWMGGQHQGEWGAGKMEQRQFAKAWFPHSQCVWRELNVLAHLDSENIDKHLAAVVPGYDVGLVRTWHPFRLTKTVSLVPLLFGKDLINAHHSNINSMAVCVFYGWGIYDSTGSPSEVLRYAFVHTFCSTDCYGKDWPEEARGCQICSSSVARPDKGIRNLDVGKGDSGGPLMCQHNGRTFQMGVVNRKFAYSTPYMNFTNGLFFNVKCVTDLITKKHTDYLRKLHDDSMESLFKNYKLNLAQVPMGFYDRNKL